MENKRRNAIAVRSNRIPKKNKKPPPNPKRPIKKKFHALEFGPQQFRKFFFENTTIGGVRRLLGERSIPTWYHRVIWLLMWLTAISLAFFLCMKSVILYLKFDVRTSIRFDTFERFDFPAITFCNENMFRRSIAGGSFFAMMALANFYSKDPKGIYQMAVENNKTCSVEKKSKIIEEFDAEGVNFFRRHGINKALELTGMGSDIGLRKCWWNDEIFDCKRSFVDRVTDYGLCFTFDPTVRSLAESNVRSNEPLLRERCISLIADPDGLPSVDHHIVANFGPSSGLKVLINVNQSEYCGAGKKYHGVGYTIKIHSPDIEPRISSETFIRLHPGHHYNVVIKPVVVRRNIEHLGRCVSTMNSILYPNTNRYFLQACVWDGYLFLIWKLCHCYHIAFEGGQKKFAEKLRLPETNLTSCWGDGLNCVKQVDEIVLSHSLEQLFVNCKQPCFETKYDYQLSSKRISGQNIQADFGLNETEFRNNFALVNLFFDSFTLQIIEESQKYTLLDLYRYFGGIMSLFIGVSVMVLPEIVYFIVRYVHLALEHARSKFRDRRRIAHRVREVWISRT